MSGGGQSSARQVLGPIAILLVTGLALVLAATGHGPPEPTRTEAPGVESNELIRVSLEREPEVARRVALLRKLEFTEIPKPEVLTGAELGALEQRGIERRGGPDPLGADEAVVRILGLLEPDEELEALEGASGELAAAAYDPRTGRLYVISDAIGASPALVDFVLAHELTHAIEDQEFGLTNLSTLGNDDVALSRLALTEGTATSIMTEYAGRYLDPLALSLAALSIDPDTAEVPAFAVEQITWAYLGGMRFVEKLREVAGGWKLVDYAIASRPPASTEQVLHPEKYLRDERAVAVSTESRELRERGWRVAISGVAGEYGTRQLLELGVDSQTAELAAAGWGGDRYGLWRRDTAPGGCADPCRKDFALVLRWKLDSNRDARELAEALEAYAIDGLDGTVGAGSVAVEGGEVALAARRDEVALVFAPEGELARAVADEQVGR